MLCNFTLILVKNICVTKGRGAMTNSNQRSIKIKMEKTYMMRIMREKRKRRRKGEMEKEKMSKNDAMRFGVEDADE